MRKVNKKIRKRNPQLENCVCRGGVRGAVGVRDAAGSLNPAEPCGTLRNPAAPEKPDGLKNPAEPPASEKLKNPAELTPPSGEASAEQSGLVVDDDLFDHAVFALLVVL